MTSFNRNLINKRSNYITGDTSKKVKDLSKTQIY